MAFGVIGMLGLIPFVCQDKKVLTFKDLQRSRTMRFAKHDVIGKKPVLEKMGMDLNKVSFTMQLKQNLLKNVPGIVPTTIIIYNKLMEQAEPLTLIIGGEILGKYVIESIDEERRYHTGAGICVAADLSITLVEFAG